jgi:hypothetical protein
METEWCCERGAAIMLSGIALLWFVLTALSVLFVAVDIRSTPESPVLKWAFILITAYAGPLGAFFYVLGCREPLPGLHERYVAARWRQVLGSTMHCVAGDGVGILAGAVLGAVLHLPPAAHIAFEYVLGFGFGWTIFQALFMRDMAGGSFRRSLGLTFVPEFLSMNLLMAGMLPVMTILMASIAGSESPLSPFFWFVMSIALLAGAIAAFPINWWLVARHLKHGMMTVRPQAPLQTPRPERLEHFAHGDMAHQTMTGSEAVRPSASAILGMGILSSAVFGLILATILIFPVHHR